MIRQRKPIRRKTPLKRSTKPIRREGRKGRERKNYRREVRSEYVKKYGSTCQWCGIEDTLDIHHKKKRSVGGEDTLENCIALCRCCHSLAHSSPANLQKVAYSSISLANPCKLTEII